MARTNQRTQQILGMLLECARIDMENLDSMHPYMVKDLDFDALLLDDDYQQAQQLFFNLMSRLICKNQARIDGANARTLSVIDGEEE